MPLPIKGLTEIERKDDVRVYVLFGLSEDTLQQERWSQTGEWMLSAFVVEGSTLEGKEDLLLSGMKLVLSDPNNKVVSLFSSCL